MEQLERDCLGLPIDHVSVHSKEPKQDKSSFNMTFTHVSLRVLVSFSSAIASTWNFDSGTYLSDIDRLHAESRSGGKEGGENGELHGRY